MNDQAVVDLDTISLAFGAHYAREDGMCLLEAVAYVAGEPHTDRPKCACPVLAAFGRTWNDALDDEDRQRLLRPFIRRLVGTRSTAKVELRRAFMAADWAVRVAAPVWLRAAGIDDAAGALEALPPLTSAKACRKAVPTIHQAREAAAAALAAAVDATGYPRGIVRAAGSTVTAAGAVSAAVGAGAEVVFVDGAEATFVAASTATAGGVAMNAAGAAVAAATGAASGAAVGGVAGAAGAAGVTTGVAPWVAITESAMTALRPHVEQLQTSAADLFERMIEAQWP